MQPHDLSSVSSQRAALNRFIRSCVDDGRAFRNVAYASEEQLRRLLAMSRQRSVFVEVLSSHLRRLGGRPRRHQSVSGRLRRAYFDLKAILSGDHHLGDELKQCAQVEERSIHAYDKAIERTEWAPDTSAVIRAQLDEMRADHDTVRQWRGSI